MLKELFLVISHSGLRIFFYYILFKTRAGNGEGELNQGTGSISEKLSPYPSEPVPLNGHDPMQKGIQRKPFSLYSLNQLKPKPMQRSSQGRPVIPFLVRQFIRTGATECCCSAQMVQLEGGANDLTTPDSNQEIRAD